MCHRAHKQREHHEEDGTKSMVDKKPIGDGK